MDWIKFSGEIDPLSKHYNDELSLQFIKATIAGFCDAPSSGRQWTNVVRIARYLPNRFAITFDPMVPPFVYANLIGALDRRTHLLGQVGARHAGGYLTSPATGTRYHLSPNHAFNPNRDTLTGVSRDGKSISVYLPELYICELTTRLPFPDDSKVLPTVRDCKPAESFEVMLHSKEMGRNPHFDITHELDFKWNKIRNEQEE